MCIQPKNKDDSLNFGSVGTLVSSRKQTNGKHHMVSKVPKILRWIQLSLPRFWRHQCPNKFDNFLISMIAADFLGHLALFLHLVLVNLPLCYSIYKTYTEYTELVFNFCKYSACQAFSVSLFDMLIRRKYRVGV